MALILDRNVGHTPTQTRADRAAGMIQDLRRLGVPASIGSLSYGDVSFTGYGPDSREVAVGIELKTINGFLTDMTTGRFIGHQLPGMQRAYHYRYLILEGPYRPGSDAVLEICQGAGRWVPASPRLMFVDFTRFLSSITLRGGFHVYRTWGRFETILTVAAEYKGWRVPWDRHKSLKHFDDSRAQGVVMMQEPSLTRRWAKELDKVGWEKSAAVERHFGTPLAMAQAPKSEWLRIPGIGPTIATRAWRMIRGLK